MRYWLGPWQWIENAWQPPPGALAALDLRSLPQCATPITPLGFGLFGTADAAALGADYRDFGTSLQSSLSGAMKKVWESALKIKTLASSRLDQMVWQTLTLQADPAGLDSPLPLVPTVDAHYELWFAGSKILSKKFASGDSESVLLRDLLQRQYRAHRQASKDGKSPPEHYRKVLGGWVRKYRLPYDWFQPSDLPSEPDLAPSTSYSDTFNRADESPLAAPWAAVSATGFDLVSNQARASATNPTISRYDSDLSSDDMRGSVTVINYGSVATMVSCISVRFDSGANTQYNTAFRSDGLQRLDKIIAGVPTGISSLTGQDASTPMVFDCSVNGSTLRAYRAGVQIINGQTDTSITGNLRGGMRGKGSAVAGDRSILDAFTLADWRLPSGLKSWRLNSLLSGSKVR